MIIDVGSSLPSFKTVRFRQGLNVLLSTKAAGSDDRQTRNSAGKSSLVEIVHFLLGAKADPGSLMRHQALKDHTFYGTFLIAGREVRVERVGAKSSQIRLDAETIAFFRLEKKVDGKSGVAYVSNEDWKQFLGHAYFDLPEDVSGTAFDRSFTPGFRSMFGYFARRQGSGGFIHPEKQAEAQQRWDWQESLSYLLGLDWKVPFELQLVRQREGQLGELKRAAKGGALGAVIGTVAELRPELVQAQDRANRLKEETARFRVHGAYEEMMAEAAGAKAEMQAILRREVPLQETVRHIDEALQVEREADPDDVTRVYEAVGVELPDTVRRRFEDVERFHRSVIDNRRLRLREEREQAQRAIDDGRNRIAKLDDVRGTILQSLDGQGALSDFIALQGRLAQAEAEAASLAERFKAAEALESENTQLTIDRASIKRRLQDDHQRRRERLDYAILLIGRTIRALYGDRRGNFEVEATENGPEFRISIEGDRGGGIASMEIFCLDLALFTLWLEKGKGPGFLIHDSHLFDGVDARQIGAAVELAGRVAESHGGQYIVTLNSDIWESLSWSEGADADEAVISPRLSDADDQSGLFGFRFD
jgi:uncharacterized protein YydD (DUF2326 family)